MRMARLSPRLRSPTAGRRTRPKLTAVTRRAATRATRRAATPRAPRAATRRRPPRRAPAATATHTATARRTAATGTARTTEDTATTDRPTVLSSGPSSPRVAGRSHAKPSNGATTGDYCGCRAHRRGLARDDLVDLVSDEAVGLAVHGVGGVRVRRIDQAEDLAVGLVDPVALVVDTVVALDRQVGLVRLRDVAGVDRAVHVVNVHVERHIRPPPPNGRTLCPFSGRWPE